ncbi:MAG: single-stranded DNA-binding protein [Opitutales bacterium]|nr:single-stranded DNA-binding protein [Opitutales bacterium]
MPSRSKLLIAATRELSDAVGALKFSDPVAYVYNPLEYARETHEQFLARYGNGSKRFVFLGMNPGPFGMAQTGVPFGEIDAVQNWLGIFGFVGKPPQEHPAKPVDGFGCPRSEVSGRRLWGLFRERFGAPENFFREHFVTNFCPLLFVAGNERGKNLTPEDLVPAERDAVNAPCDLFLRRLAEILEPEWLVGVGNFAETAAKRALAGMPVKFTRIIHPSPASPAANKDWSGNATAKLISEKIWHA